MGNVQIRSTSPDAKFLKKTHTVITVGVYLTQVLASRHGRISPKFMVCELVQSELHYVDVNES